MVPASSRSSASPPDAAALRTNPRVASLTTEELVCPSPSAPSPGFELRCADAHPTGCAAVLRAERAGDVVALACEHGARVHGFTAVWYGPPRLELMAAAVTRPAGGTR